jgi:type II secretory pathway component PulM
MSKNEINLLRIFGTLCLAIAMACCAFNLAERSNAARKKIAQYETALAKIPEVDTDIETLEKEMQELRTLDLDAEAARPKNVIELTGIVRDELAKQGIVPTRMQISGKEGSEIVDLSIVCDPHPFFTFLESHSGANSCIKYESLSIRQRREGNTIEISMRITNEK